MTETTPLDAAHAAMEAKPEDAAARLRFYERLADGELFLLLAEDPVGDRVTPAVFEVEEASFVLVFDREDRLTRFTGSAAPYAAMSGRAITELLAGRNLGLGLNLDVAPSAILLSAEAVAWLTETLAHRPQAVEARPEKVTAPKGLPEAVVSALDTKLATAAGLARSAWLAGVTYAGGGTSHMLAFVDARDGSEAALAQAVGEALTFSGVESGAIDVAFIAAHDPLAARLAKVGLRFDLPELTMPERATPAPPGSDPAAPPKLR